MLIALTTLGCLGQPNNPDYDNRAVMRVLGMPTHFGITLGTNFSRFKIVRGANFFTNDTVYGVESTHGPGANLGLISDFKIGEHFNFRFTPGISFAEKRLNYNLFDSSSVAQKVESTNLDFPFLLKFKSDRIGNFRLYVLGGFKYSMDMASNAQARNAPDQVKIAQSDFSLEYGIGYDYYFEMFKFSIEIKASYGLKNILVQETGLVYSSVLEKLLSKGLTISMHFE